MTRLFLLFVFAVLLAIGTALLVAGCSMPNPTFAQTTADDGGRILVDAAPTPADGGPIVDLGTIGDFLSASDLLSAGDLSSVPDLLSAFDLMPPPADLACLPFVVDPVQETACTPGQEQNTKTGPSMCYRKTCGCKSRATCSDCYWSSWTAVGCAP